jgi:hypothetical protein
MRVVKLCAMLLAVILGLGCLAPNLVAQDENSNKQENSNEKQKENKKSEEGRELRQETRDESLSKPLGAYHVEFMITELDDGKKVNSRTYSLVVQQGILNKLRIGGRVPIATSGGSNSLPVQFQYLDIGVNIDCTVQEREGFVLMSSTIDVSSMAQQREEQTHQPVIRQMKSEVRTILSPGKPTVIRSMDDPTGKGRFQLEVTATKVK